MKKTSIFKVRISPETLVTARAKTRSLNISFSEYIRGLIEVDLRKPVKIEVTADDGEFDSDVVYIADAPKQIKDWKSGFESGEELKSWQADAKRRQESK